MAQARSPLNVHFRSFAASEGARSLRQQLLIVATALLIATLMIMGATLWNLKNTLRESEAAENTMLELTTVETRLVDIYGALNGYALTADAWFPQRIAGDRVDMRVAIGKLRRSLQDNPQQLKTYGEIVSLIRTQDALTDELRQHRSEALWSAKAQSAQQMIDGIRGKLWQILIAERAQRYASDQRMIGEAKDSFWLAIGIVVISVFTGLCFFGLRTTTDKPAVPSPRIG
jgi:CHASE3 domain sensor protein